MEWCLVFVRADGGLTVRHLCEHARRDGESDEAFLARAFERNRKGASSSTVVRKADLPERVFRDAWEMAGKAPSVNLPKARDIWRDRMRAARAPKLAALDAAYLRADELGDTAEKQRLAALKQQLRDVTADPAIEAARTPEELKGVWPEVLR